MCISMSNPENKYSGVISAARVDGAVLSIADPGIFQNTIGRLLPQFSFFTSSMIT